ncbi:MAG TPA: ATP-binding protein, partial [Longimicrobiales bacterium]
MKWYRLTATNTQSLGYRCFRTMAALLPSRGPSAGAFGFRMNPRSFAVSLFERDQFMREMTSALAGARAGSGSIVLVCGEAGIGKTALVDRFAQEAVVAGCSCLRGACDAFFTPRVLGPLFDFARHAGGRFEETAQANPDRERLFSMLLNELHHSRGTAVIVEDVHWADEATLDMLRFLARRIREAAAVLVITYRDDELPPRHPLRALLGVLP